ncbi:alpha-N-acetylglucosaminidase [Flavobacterium rhamnosiphilum]|uniref:Alpha-N-acetylglucosaminidase n=1 Tax=Flavobacterium rhamnosiphilum TaxID=2541724 RepID=A0A4R5FB83_9FLAO|nr:alpha-N-acetylglucosaminidase [Flavobacterium rhamnosiphilum]TDE45549.1 alpha-N-acetylglucosaminidase [Flavobacterium rhamnosiphilum]
MKIKNFALVLLIAGSIFSANSQSFGTVKELAERRVPWLAKKLVFSTIPKEDGKDVFELFSKNNKIHIAATDANTASSGLNWYLKYYCHRNMSHMGDNLSAVEKLPTVDGKVRIISPYPVRYALNYCTISYTMSFYSWKDWERELDWMALNGVNLMLAPVGMEAVWQNTMNQLGFTQKEVADFIPGPAFGAWWLMGNLEGWGGPITQTMIDQQATLEKKILKRMKELGIQPVMQGFYGMIPTTLKNKMKIEIISQGKWAGGFQRPDFLLPTDPMFKKVAGVYYTEMKKLYGSDIHFFGGDPFHEGGSSKGADLTACAKGIQQQMQQYFPASTWVLQGWQENPSKGLLDGLDRSKTLVIELFGENTANWEERKGYDGTPFVWSNVSNFGGKVGLYGKLQRFANEVHRAKNSPYGAFLKGIGIIPEGINNNSVAYDFMLELGWHTDKVDTKEWIKNYVKYRYGKSNEAVVNAWQGFLETAYSSPEVYQEGPSESIFCARPSVKIGSVSSWGTRKRNYDTQKFAEAVKLFVSASKEFEQSETYQVDRIDLVRQLQANNGDVVYQKMIDAFNAKEVNTFTSASNQFQKMIQQQDALLSCSKHFSLHTWLKQANDFGTSAADKEIALRNAKEQITFWGPTDAKTNLHEYAHKEWGGLLGSLYLERWKMFADEKIKIMNKQAVTAPNYFNMEKKWTEGKELFLPKILTPEQQNVLINTILSQKI